MIETTEGVIYIMMNATRSLPAHEEGTKGEICEVDGVALGIHKMRHNPDLWSVTDLMSGMSAKTNYDYDYLTSEDSLDDVAKRLWEFYMDDKRIDDALPMISRILGSYAIDKSPESQRTWELIQQSELFKMRIFHNFDMTEGAIK